MDPDEPTNMSSLVALEVTQAFPQRLCLNDAAPLNILSMLVTCDTSHFDMLTLNDVAFSNIETMLVTLDTSHCEMSALKDFAY